MVSAEKLLTLIDGLGGIVWEGDPETFQFSFVSAQAERILGYPVSAWYEPGFWRRHTHPDDIERCARLCLDASREGRDHRFTYRMIAADGRVVWLEDIVSVRRAPDGCPRLIGISLDITREKEQERQKEQASRLYEALIENSADNVWLLAEDGTTMYQSPSVERQLGYSHREMIGRNNFHLIHPDDLEEAQRTFAGIFRSDGMVGPVRFRLRHRDSRWVSLEAVGRRFTAEDGSTFAVVNSRDVTQALEAQRTLEATREQLAHAMKMEAIGRLAGGVAHDFNNLLTVVAGYSELLAASFDPADSRREDVDEIKRAAQRASLLTRQLLAFSRKQVLRPEVVDLNEVLAGVRLLIERLIGEDIRLQIEPSAEPLRVLADRSQLEQVTMNLAVNARDAMPRGGTLTIRTALAHDTVRLTVRDTGTGMTPEVLARLFEPFFTTKEVGKGTGLGLSTVYGIVKQSRGHIEVASRPGLGATFVVTLPAASAGQAPREGESAGMPSGTETILLVEDEREVRDLVRDVLTHLGYEVLVAIDGTAALDLARRHASAISLLLTDIVMPHMSGPDLYRRLAMLLPGVSVLYMSGYTGDEVLARGVSRETAAFLQKPFTPATLARTVRDVLDAAGETRRTG